jgi:hypothetical protein
MGTLRYWHGDMECALAFGDNDEKRCVWCGNALTGRQQRWCSKDCADEFGRNHWWGWVRKAALARDGEACVRCGADWRAGLEVNHVVPILGKHGASGCHHHLAGVETLCHECHLDETARQFGHTRRVPSQSESLPFSTAPSERSIAEAPSPTESSPCPPTSDQPSTQPEQSS